MNTRRKIMDKIKRGGATLTAFLALFGALFGALEYYDKTKYILSVFSPPTITISSTKRTITDKSPIFAEEELRVILSGVENNHVYWLFDETNKMKFGVIEEPHKFSYNPKLARGVISNRRVDAFYKSGDDYLSVKKIVRVHNMKLISTAFFSPNALNLMIPTELSDRWVLGDVVLTKLADGKLQELQIESERTTANKEHAQFTWEVNKVAEQYGYKSHNSSIVKLLLDNTAWFSARYKDNNTGEVLVVIKPLNQDNTFENYSFAQ